jgi:hypothetical protein
MMLPKDQWKRCCRGRMGRPLLHWVTVVVLLFVFKVKAPAGKG